MNHWVVKLKAANSDGRPVWVQMTSFGATLTDDRWKATLFDDSITAWRCAEDAGVELGMAFQAIQATKLTRKEKMQSRRAKRTRNQEMQSRQAKMQNRRA